MSTVTSNVYNRLDNEPKVFTVTYILQTRSFADNICKHFGTRSDPTKRRS